MNLTGRPAYQKEVLSRKAGKAPTTEERLRWGRIVLIGCIIAPAGCKGRITVHHCFTGGGGRKNHDKTIALCQEHHLGKEGIDGKRMSKREWQGKYGTEEELLEKTNKRLEELK